MPLLAIDAPAFAEGFLGIFTGSADQTTFGTLATIWTLLGPLYLLGPLLFGIATLRAGILPRWAAGLLAVASALTPAAALFPHQIQRFAAVPVALALIWLGYALWSERREQASEPSRGRGSPQFHLTGAE